MIKPDHTIEDVLVSYRTYLLDSSLRITDRSYGFDQAKAQLMSIMKTEKLKGASMDLHKHIFERVRHLIFVTDTETLQEIEDMKGPELNESIIKSNLRMQILDNIEALEKELYG